MRQVPEDEYQAMQNLEQAVRDLAIPENVIEEACSGHDYSEFRDLLGKLDGIRKAQKDSTARRPTNYRGPLCSCGWELDNGGICNNTKCTAYRNQ